MGRHGLPRTVPARKPAESTSGGAEGQRCGGGRRGGRIPAVRVYRPRP